MSTWAQVHHTLPELWKGKLEISRKHLLNHHMIKIIHMEAGSQIWVWKSPWSSKLAGDTAGVCRKARCAEVKNARREKIQCNISGQSQLFMKTTSPSPTPLFSLPQGEPKKSPGPEELTTRINEDLDWKACLWQCEVHADSQIHAFFPLVQTWLGTTYHCHLQFSSSSLWAIKYHRETESWCDGLEFQLALVKPWLSNWAKVGPR